MFCTDCFVSQTWLVFQGKVERMTRETEFPVQKAKTRRQFAVYVVSWTNGL